LMVIESDSIGSQWTRNFMLDGDWDHFHYLMVT
jgi:hypothetical protein